MILNVLIPLLFALILVAYLISNPSISEPVHTKPPTISHQQLVSHNPAINKPEPSPTLEQEAVARMTAISNSNPPTATFSPILASSPGATTLE